MPTLAQWFDQLMQREWSRVRPGTRERREIDHRRLAPLASKRLDQLTVPVIHSWLHETIDRDGNRRCVQAALETLDAMLTVAVQHRLLPENPAKHVRYPVEHMQRREQTALSHDEYRTLLDACQSVAERSFLRVLCEAGLRRSEAIALQIGDLDLDAGLIHIQRRHYRCADGSVDTDTPKSRKTRHAAINGSLASDLQEAIAGRIAGRERAADAPVWTRQNRYTGGEAAPLTGAAAYKLLAHR